MNPADLATAARSLVADDRLEDALAVYERLVALTPDDVAVLLEHAYLCSYAVVVDWPTAPLWDRLVAVAPENVEVLFWSAHQLLDAGADARAEAQRRLRRVVALDPENRSGYVGCAHLLLGTDADCLCHLERAVSADPGAPGFHHRLALAYERRSRWPEALLHFERALAGSRHAARAAGDSRERYKAEVLEGRAVPGWVLGELRAGIERVRANLEATS